MLRCACCSCASLRAPRPSVLPRGGAFAAGLRPQASASARCSLAFGRWCGVLGLCLVWGCIGRGLQLADQLRPRACTEFAWLELLGSATAAGQFAGECEAARAMLLGPALAEARLHRAGQGSSRSCTAAIEVEANSGRCEGTRTTTLRSLVEISCQ